MASVRDLGAAAAALQMERWFPSNLPDDIDQRFEARGDACVAFTFEAVRTKDEHEFLESPFKPFPGHVVREDGRCVHCMISRWLRGCIRYQICHGPKSRQNFASWVTADLCTYLCHERPGVTIILMQKKLEDGEQQIKERVNGTLVRSFPPWLLEQFRYSERENELHVLERRIKGKWVNWDSRLYALPQGPDQIAGKVASVLWVDEAALQRKLQGAHRVFIPTIMSRGAAYGKLITTSSCRRASFFNRELLEPKNFKRARAVARGLVLPEAA